MKFFLKGLYFITDRTLSKKSVLEDVKAAIRGGASIIQYREKNLSDEQMTEEARLIAGLCKNNGVIFIINDRLEVVLACNADGIHLGPYDTDFLSARKTLGPGKIIGITVSSLEDAKRFEKLGADYVSLSPIHKKGCRRTDRH
jgi:thiamine-phosphate pyrophosphorylase